MATNRTVPELLQMFREGLPPMTITSAYFRDMIQSLHPSTGEFVGLATTPGNIQPGMLWLNGDILQMSLGTGPLQRQGTFRGSGNGSLVVANPRQRMLGRTQYGGRGSFAASATPTTPNPPGQSPFLSDDFNTFDQNMWSVDSYDEGGDAFWSADPADVADVFTTSGGRLNFAIINRSSGGKSLTTGVIDNFNSPGGGSHGLRYGYWEVAVAVDRYAGFEWEIDVIGLPSFASYMCPVRIWTDGSNVQQVIQFTYDTPIIVGTDSNSGWDASVSHTYGVELNATALRFYRDRVLTGDFGNPGGGYSTTELKYSKTWCQTNFTSGVSVNPAGLPKYAHLDYFKAWATRPF